MNSEEKSNYEIMEKRIVDHNKECPENDLDGFYFTTKINNGKNSASKKRFQIVGDGNVFASNDNDDKESISSSDSFLFQSSEDQEDYLQGNIEMSLSKSSNTNKYHKNDHYQYMSSLQQKLGPEMSKFFSLNIVDMDVIKELEKRYNNNYKKMSIFLAKLIEIEKKYDDKNIDNKEKIKILEDMKTALENSHNRSIIISKLYRKKFNISYKQFIQNYMRYMGNSINGGKQENIKNNIFTKNENKNEQENNRKKMIKILYDNKTKKHKNNEEQEKDINSEITTRNKINLKDARTKMVNYFNK